MWFKKIDNKFFELGGGYSRMYYDNRMMQLYAEPAIQASGLNKVS